ncbi:MAG: hypothetical protein BWX77_00459 [Bacteroidetes bacterium ADurb.Bin090]|nr:MAG: hypothetical protein BWX77_00459 [Bacteroidetes bacterium ADurb.Bin090]
MEKKIIEFIFNFLIPNNSKLYNREPSRKTEFFLSAKEPADTCVKRMVARVSKILYRLSII